MTTATTIAGNLTRDPEIRYTRDGQATTSLSVATNRRFTTRGSDEWQETTSYFDVVCWRDLVENVALSLTKGTRVVVTGHLEQRTWTTDEGEQRFRIELVAEEGGASLRFATAEVTKHDRQGAEAGETAIAEPTPTSGAGQVRPLATPGWPTHSSATSLASKTRELPKVPLDPPPLTRVSVKVQRSQAEEFECPGDVATDRSDPGRDVGVARDPQGSDRQVA